MKKITFLLLAVSAIILASCAGGQQYVCGDGTLVDDPSQCSPTPSEPEQEVQVPEQPVEEPDYPADTQPPAPEEQEPEEESNIEKIAASARAQEMVEMADEKVNSFSFVYVGPPENLPTDKYYVRGNKILVELHPDTNFKQTQPYSHVYIDTEAGTATAYCLAQNRAWCPNGNERYGTIDADEFMIRTPYQWLTMLESAEYLGGGQQWESRATDRVRFTTTDDESGEMFVLSFYGLPGKINLDNGDTIEFRDLSVNSVTEEQVTEPEL